MRLRALLTVALLLSAPARGAETSPLRLIAHRGGVVEDRFPDNSAAALEEAIARGYWMVEIDLRESRDGVIVLRHDPDLQAHYGDARTVQEMTWEELSLLRTSNGRHRLWRLEDLLKAARGRIRLMLDTKSPHSPEFPARIEHVLRQYDALDGCYVIGTREGQEHFTGLARVGLKYGGLQAAAEREPEAAERYFLFGHGDMSQEMVRWAQQRRIPVVASINIFHYYDAATMQGRPRGEIEPLIMAAARRDIEKLRRWGVTEFQIDSEFERWFEPGWRNNP